MRTYKFTNNKTKQQITKQHKCHLSKHKINVTDNTQGLPIALAMLGSHRRCSVKKGVLKNLSKFTGKPLCQTLFFNKVEFCEVFKNTFFTEHLWTTASGD